MLTGLYSARHTQDENPDELGWYGAPALLQRLTKATPLFLSCTIIIILCIELIHAFLKMLLEVLN
jgi:hypothetical protein